MSCQAHEFSCAKLKMSLRVGDKFRDKAVAKFSGHFSGTDHLLVPNICLVHTSNLAHPCNILSGVHPIANLRGLRQPDKH